MQKSILSAAIDRLTSDLENPERREIILNVIRKNAKKVKSLSDQGKYDLHMSEHIPDSLFRKPFEVVK